MILSTADSDTAYDCVFILRKEIRRFADSLSNLDLDGGKRTNDDE